MNKKLLLPVGVVVLIIGIAILLLNPDPGAANLEIARNATNAQAVRITNLTHCGILLACSVVV